MEGEGFTYVGAARVDVDGDGVGGWGGEVWARAVGDGGADADLGDYGACARVSAGVRGERGGGDGTFADVDGAEEGELGGRGADAAVVVDGGAAGDAGEEGFADDGVIGVGVVVGVRAEV